MVCVGHIRLGFRQSCRVRCDITAGLCNKKKSPCLEEEGSEKAGTFAIVYVQYTIFVPPSLENTPSLNYT
jgi:hypothetical protein